MDSVHVRRVLTGNYSPLVNYFDFLLFILQINEDKISSPKVTCLACGEKCDYGLLKYHRENECKQATFTVKVLCTMMIILQY